MNVKDIQAAALSAAFGKRGKKEEPEGTEFQKILEQAESARKAGMSPDAFPAGGAGGIEAGPALSISSAPFLAGLQPPSILQAEGTLASERTLALLERFQAAIADPNRPAGEIRPVVESLSAQLNDLTQRMGKISTSDPLQGIMTAIGVLSSVEIEKFNRGDYS